MYIYSNSNKERRVLIYRIESYHLIFIGKGGGLGWHKKKQENIFEIKGISLDMKGARLISIHMTLGLSQYQHWKMIKY